MTAEMNSCEILNLFSSISNTFSVFMAKFFTSELANEWNNLAMKTENKLEIELNKLRIKPRIHFCQMRQTSTIENYNFYPKEYSFLLWLIFFKSKKTKKKMKMVFLFYRRNFKSMTSWRLNLNGAEIWRGARALSVGKSNSKYSVANLQASQIREVTKVRGHNLNKIARPTTHEEALGFQIFDILDQKLLFFKQYLFHF